MAVRGKKADPSTCHFRMAQGVRQEKILISSWLVNCPRTKALASGGQNAEEEGSTGPGRAGVGEEGRASWTRLCFETAGRAKACLSHERFLINQRFPDGLCRLWA